MNAMSHDVIQRDPSLESSPATSVALDIEHVFVEDDPRKWSDTRKVDTAAHYLPTSF